MHPGFVSYYLTAGTYSFANNQVFPNKLLCIEDGQIEVNPPIGDSFIWNATYGKKIEITFSMCTVLTGTFIIFFHKIFNPGSDIKVYFYLIDEYYDSFSDEIGDTFMIL